MQNTSSIPNHSAINHTLAVQLIVEKQWEFCKDWHLYITCVDLKAAFDLVHHLALWTILRTISVPEKIITLFFQKNCYDQTVCCLQVTSKESIWFPVKSGVKQDSVAALEPFNCVMSPLMNQICQRIRGVGLGYYYMKDLEFADDTTLFINTFAGSKLEENQADACWWWCRSISQLPFCPPLLILGTPSIASDHFFWTQVISADRLINDVVLLQPPCSHYGIHSEDKIVSAARQSYAYIMHQCYQSYFTIQRLGLSDSYSPKKQMALTQDCWESSNM